MKPDFLACGSKFINHSADLYGHYVYQGPVRDALVSTARPTLITLQGCKELCGTGTAYYSWQDASNTITTWVLPIIGLLLQAPYESNKNWDTVLLLSRWVGNPISALSYILWNIKVTGKCALMADMATMYEEFPSEHSEFSLMRDSLFILCVMNQYSVKPELPPIEAERLLRIALFSNMLQLPSPLNEADLVSKRTKLARDLREGRKKGVVPVFVSFLWFVFALALTIQLAFGSIGDNQTAHNLAIGFLSGWLPIMVLASTVDRNSVSADSIQTRLNTLLEDVRSALLDQSVRLTYMRNTNTGPEDFEWCKSLEDEVIFDGTFFTDFSGQGRRHWHYGVAHSLLAGIESNFMARYGRDWLREGYAARLAIVVRSRNINGLKMVDARMVWQIMSSVFIVCGCAGGAFVLSYFTPTVGLGCRSGGYLVYMIVAVGLLIVELVVWYMTHETATKTSISAQTRLRSTWKHFSSQSKRGISVRARLNSSARSWWSQLSSREAMKNFVIRPGEAFNSAWLVYMVVAQTFGAFQRCDCLASTWAGEGAYIDFETFDQYGARGMYYYWEAATALSITVMSAGLAYIAVEYCTQSHLSTEDYGRAMQGLKQTRKFKKHTLWIRIVPNVVITFGKRLLHRFSSDHTGRRSLVWTAKTQGHTDFFETSKENLATDTRDQPEAALSLSEQ